MHRLTEKDDQGNWALKGVKWESLHAGQTITREMWEKIYSALWKLYGGAAARYREAREGPDATADGRSHHAALYRV